MSQLVISNVEESVFQRLRQRASSHGRTPETEAKAIIEAALLRDKQDIWAQVNAHRAKLAASGRDFGDSTEEIREDRER